MQVGKKHYYVDMLVMGTTYPFIEGLNFLKAADANTVMIGHEVIPTTTKRNLSNE